MSAHPAANVAWLMESTHGVSRSSTSSRVIHILGKRHFTEGYYKQALFKTTWLMQSRSLATCCSECCKPFQGLWLCCTFRWINEHWVTVTLHGSSFMVICWNPWKSTPTSLLGKLVRCSLICPGVWFLRVMKLTTLCIFARFLGFDGTLAKLLFVMLRGHLGSLHQPDEKAKVPSNHLKMFSQLVMRFSTWLPSRLARRIVPVSQSNSVINTVKVKNPGECSIVANHLWAVHTFSSILCRMSEHRSHGDSLFPWLLQNI